MLKELHLIARTVYSFIAVLAFTGVTGLELSMGMLMIGVMIFSNSFLFQYFVLHFALKKIMTTVRGRLLFLIGWLVFCLVGLVGSSMMIPQMQDLQLYASPEEFALKGSIWGSVFIAFSAAFVALACTRRAFARHGALG